MRDEDVVRVHEAGLRILDQTGVLFEDVGALTFLRECGCRVDGTRVRIPGEVVATALNSVPRSFASAAVIAVQAAN